LVAATESSEIIEELGAKEFAARKEAQVSFGRKIPNCMKLKRF